MKREPAPSRPAQERPAQAVAQRRIWRVFEYRRPVPARRIRFTT